MKEPASSLRQLKNQLHITQTLTTEENDEKIERLYSNLISGLRGRFQVHASFAASWYANKQLISPYIGLRLKPLSQALRVKY